MCGALAGAALACGSDDGGNPLDDRQGPAVGADGGASDAGSGADGQAATQEGGATADGGSTDAAVSDEDCNGLNAIIRDFTDAHPDFEAYRNTMATTGIVESMLGADNKPVFRNGGGQVTSAQSFAQWYNDAPGINQQLEIARLQLSPVPGGYEYDNSEFFPIDGRGFGNYQNTGHNYHFTTEIHTQFTYKGGERFAFRGDDDLWIFVNGRLALDLGGLHPALEGLIDFDAQAGALGIQQGSTYRMDIFHAERRTEHSNFRITTNIECFMDVPLL